MSVCTFVCVGASVRVCMFICICLPTPEIIASIDLNTTVL